MAGNTDETILRRLEMAECPICSDLFTPAQETLCGHSFCHDCTQRYVMRNSKCPVCKSDFSFINSNVDDAVSTQNDEEEIVPQEQSLEQMELLHPAASGGGEEFSSGDVLKFKVTFARSHFAVYAGYDKIIHYQKELGKHKIIEETIQQFLQREGLRYHVKKAQLGFIDRKMHRVFPRDEVVRRARHHLGRNEYNIAFENSEHFAKWCKYGVKMSDRVEGAGVAATGGVGLAGGAATGALIGGVAGSVVPVVGNIVGAVVGAGIGAATGGGMGALGGWGTSKIIRKLRAGRSM